jgi:hypothetical protein
VLTDLVQVHVPTDSPELGRGPARHAHPGSKTFYACPVTYDALGVHVYFFYWCLAGKSPCFCE